MTTTTAKEVTHNADLAELIQDHQADVWRYLRFLGCDGSEADDLVQETFLQLVRRPLEQRSHAMTSAYLRKVARNQLLQARRRQGREPQVSQLELAESVWAKATNNASFNDYIDALSGCLEMAIDERQRRAVNLRYRDRNSRQQIAEILELTADGVKTLLRRTRSALRSCVERKMEQWST